MESEKKIEFVRESEVVVDGIRLDMENEKIKKLYFTTDIGEITWKPKKRVEEFVDGFKTEQFALMSISDLPDKIKQIRDYIKDKGKCTVKANYQLMTTTNPENQVVKYRFITSATFLDNWNIVEAETVKVEKVA